MHIEFKEWDSEVLGIRCGRACNPKNGEKHNYDFLHARVPIGHDWAIADFRRRGFRIVGIHQELSRNLKRFPPETSPAVMPKRGYRYAKEEDADAMGELARRLFEHDRMHADPLIPDSVADYYKSVWGRNTCLGYAAMTPLVTDMWGIVGFVAVRHLSLYFIGVRKDRRRHGLGRTLVELACRDVRSMGHDTIKTATQGGNVAALNMYTKAGFVLGQTAVDMHWIRDDYVFHHA